MNTCTESLRGICFVVFDFDGVFTNNMVYISQDGIESVRCCRSDGLGLRRLDDVGVSCMVLSTETNPVVSVRAEKLKIDCRQGIEDKLTVLDEEREMRGLSWEQIAYVGNDINDADCLRAVGLPVVVADAFDEVKPLAELVLTRKGGEGAVREFCDLIWRAKGEELRDCVRIARLLYCGSAEELRDCEIARLRDCFIAGVRDFVRGIGFEDRVRVILGII